MPLSEIEMYDPKIFLRVPHLRRWSIAFVLVALAAVGLVRSADAAPQPVRLFADHDLGDALIQAVQTPESDGRRLEVRPSASAAACSAAIGATPRLALLARTPSRTELDRCGQAISATVSTVEIGRQAVAVVVPINSPAWSVDATALFRALGQNNGGTQRASTWAGIDPSYPNLPIGLLLPPANSRTRRLFDSSIMQAGCERAANGRTPFDLKSRSDFCNALRSDIQISERDTGVDGVASWAAAAQPGQIAVVSVAELRQLDRRVVPLVFDGALPTAANIESGRYPASGTVVLMVVLPTSADPKQRAEARGLAFDLLAEASIGPSGRLAPGGLIPLPPSERIAARSQAIAFLEQR
jgi:phosphate transport system substrate-binding protein